MKVSPDNNNQLDSASKSINKYETRQTNSSRSYAATINNNNTTVNDDLSDLNDLMSELHKLKQLIDIPHMIMVIKNLNNKLINAKNGMEKLQAFIEASELIERNG